MGEGWFPGAVDTRGVRRSGAGGTPRERGSWAKEERVPRCGRRPLGSSAGESQGRGEQATTAAAGTAAGEGHLTGT